MDVGKGREQDAVSFAYMDVGKGREQEAGNAFAAGYGITADRPREEFAKEGLQ